MSKEAYHPFFGGDLSRFGEGAVLGGPIYEEVREKSRKPASKEEKKEGFFGLLVRRAPLLIPSLGGLFLVGCTRGAPAVLYPEEPPALVSPGPEELTICPPIPESCLIINQEGNIFRGETLKDHRPGWRICYHGLSIVNPEEYLVDIWTVDNKEELANCLLACNRTIWGEEIEEICDEDEEFPVPTPTPELLPSGLLEVSYTANK